ncbi:MAG: flagellar hook-basal body complex protein FliE [Tissierellia bacterium]|nr:flagellar hook-basal body complex protein FliE [Tissierellia bacterium]
MEIKTIGAENLLSPWDKEVENTVKEGKRQFSEILNNALDNVNRLQLESDEYRNLLITGEIDNLHDVTIAQEKANIALQLTLSIRNKILEAYREIMRMQI